MLRTRGEKKRGARVEQIWAQLEIPYPSLKCQVDKILYAMVFFGLAQMNQSSKNTCQKQGISKKNCNQFQWLFWWWKYIFQISHDLEIFRSCFRKKLVGCISDLTWTCLRLQSEEPPKFENRLQFTTCQLAIDYLCFSETNHRLLKVSDDICLLIESKRTTSTHRADWIKTS